MRRKHSKISDLPPGIKTAVDSLLAQGHTYEAIAAELESRGYKVGKSSVGRYAKDVAEVARELNLVTEQLRPILEQVKDNPNLELGSVATQMGLMQVIGFLKSGAADDEKSKASALAAICQAAAQLHRSQAAVEKYRMEWREKIEKTRKEIADAAASEELTQDKIDRIFSKLTGV